MSPWIAAVVFALGILGLFRLDRDPKSRTSKALWIPVVWTSIGGSRTVAQWLQIAPPNSVDQLLVGNPLDRNVFAALVTFGIIVLVRRGPKVGTLLRANGPILLFFSYCAFSILWSDYPDVTFKHWIKALGDLVMVLIVLTDPDPSTAVKRFLARVGLLLLPISVLLIKYYPELGRAYDPWNGTQSYTGVATDKNMLGMVCLVFGLGSTWRIIEEFRSGEGSRRTRSLIAHGALLAMALWLLWIANSMTSLSCFLLATGLLAATSLRAAVRKPWVVHLLVAMVLFTASSVLFLDLGGNILETMGRDSTLTGRTFLWTKLIEMNQSPLLGAGFESFWLGQRLRKIWSMVPWHPNEAHNGYLEVFLNLGWMGVALLGFLIAIGYRNVVGAFRRDPEAGRLRLAYFVVGTAFSFTEAGFRTMNPVWIAFFLSIIGSAAAFTATGGTSDSAALVLTGEETFSSNRG